MRDGARRAAPQRRGRAARLAEPSHARQLRRHRVRHAEPRPVRRRRSTRFTRHVTGSLPCMPARHDILCGALDFLWRPWGSIELWEQPITADLRDARRDHDAGHRSPAPVRDRRRELPHRLRRVGLRARPRGRPVEDVARPVVDRRARRRRRRRATGSCSDATATHAPTIDRAYDRTRTYFRDETDYPGPRTMSAAADVAGEAPRSTTRRSAGCCSSTSSTRTSRSTRPSHGRAMYEDEPWAGRAADLAAVRRRRPSAAVCSPRPRHVTSVPTTAPS